MLVINGIKLQKSIASQAQAKCFKRDHFRWLYIAQIHIASQFFNEPGLLFLLWCFEKQVFTADLIDNFIDEARSDLTIGPENSNSTRFSCFANHFPGACFQDRKSTRLNSSHVAISYAVFCLKKKTSLPRR